MARLDVYGNPDAAERKLVFFFLDLQNGYLDGLDTHVFVPLRVAHGFRRRILNLNPEFEVPDRP